MCYVHPFGKTLEQHQNPGTDRLKYRNRAPNLDPEASEVKNVQN